MTTSEWPAVAFSDGSKSKCVREACQSVQVAAANVLMVGAGGIGCELVKTLVLSGFRKITMVDMDTIEVSNLNRQFLFRKRHVGQSKAKVAAEAVKAFCPDAELTTLQENVKEGRFDVAIIKTFSLVLNGLDNDEARRHVNRLCLAAEVPLVESGTTGYKGQVSVHLKGESECYECMPRQAPKGFPICTIRNTPDKDIHCIVWAKDLLFERLFGPPEAVTDLDEAPAGDKEAGEAEADAGAPAASDYVRAAGEDAWAYARRILDLVFHRDVKRVAGIEALWAERPPPTPLPPAAEALAGVEEPTEVPEGGVLEFLGLNPREVWSVADTARALATAIYAFHTRRAADVGSTSFTKDDDLSVTIVAAASNLRSHCYGIPRLSEFAAKGKAGNIIHAIATTNAIVAGYIVLEATKLLNGCKAALRSSFLTGAQPNSYGKLSVATPLPPPNPACLVCGAAIAHLATNTETFTLGQLVDGVLKKRLAFVHPMVTLDNFLYEEGDDLDAEEREESAAHLPTALAALPGGGVRHGARVTVTDQTQDMTVTLVVQHAELSAQEHPEGFLLTGDKPVAVAAAPEAAADEAGPSTSAGPLLGKRKADAAASDAPPAKRQTRSDDDGVVLLDSSDDEGPAAAGAADSDSDVIAIE